jgi:2-haloacid dehalogenase
MARAIVFDVNETLLDLSGLEPLFEAAIGEAGPRAEWFCTLQELWLTASVTGAYADFDVLSAAALRMVAERRRRVLHDAVVNSMLEEMRRLQPHRDAVEGLSRLRNAGLPLAALTNGTLAVARAQLEHAGLAHYFVEIVSADEARRFKPAPEPYRLAAARLQVDPAEMRMVAAHPWDVAGAAAAGCATAFLARPGKVRYPHLPPADLSADDLVELSQQILRVDRAEGAA